MISPENFVRHLALRGINFFSGVPDSALSGICNYLDRRLGRDCHAPAVNEGSAVSIAMGYHFGSGKIPMVYLQNSGLGNAVNPLASLASPEIYAVPMLLMIGWRGMPGKKDEPQHVLQGRVTTQQLDLLDIPYAVIHAEEIQWRERVDGLINLAVEGSRPVALICHPKTFEDLPFERTLQNKNCSLTRELALATIYKTLVGRYAMVATTGKCGRELHEIVEKEGGDQDSLLVVGGMGHAISICLGLCLGSKSQDVALLDGDGAFLMHMGTIATVGAYRPTGLLHILLNNGCHESVGGQPTNINTVDIEQLIKSVGYEAYQFADSIDTLEKSLEAVVCSVKPAFLEIKINALSRNDLGRPTHSPGRNKEQFMQRIRATRP